MGRIMSKLAWRFLRWYMRYEVHYVDGVYYVKSANGALRIARNAAEVDAITANQRTIIRYADDVLSDG
jgi:hypothetical protein